MSGKTSSESECMTSISSDDCSDGWDGMCSSDVDVVVSLMDCEKEGNFDCFLVELGNDAFLWGPTKRSLGGSVMWVCVGTFGASSRWILLISVLSELVDADLSVFLGVFAKVC